MRSFVCLLLLPLGVLAADSRRPYEMEQAGRVADAHVPLDPLTSADGWTVRVRNAEARFVRTTERLLFGDGVCRLTYRATGPSPEVEFVPPTPRTVPPGCDAMSVWCYGNNIFGRDPSTPSTTLSVVFRTVNGKEVRVPFGPIVHREWHLLHMRFPQRAAEALADGGAVEALCLTGGTNTQFRVLDFNSLCVFRESFAPLTFAPRAKPSFPTSPDGFFPPAAHAVRDERIEFRLPSDPTRWDDLAVRLDGGEWIPLARGGGVWPEAVARTARVDFSRVGNALVAEVSAPEGGEPAEIRFGRPELPEGARRIVFPYYTLKEPNPQARPAVLAVPGRTGHPATFVSGTFDWYASAASSLGFAAGAEARGLNADMRYYLMTDRRRNAVRERFVWAVGDRIDAVLPEIPNPPSPYRREVGTRAWATHGVTDRETKRAKDAAYWRDVKARGMTRMIVTDHESGWRDGEESFTCRTNTAPAKGGNASQAEYARTMIDELGFLYGPYHNYVDLAPVNANWDVDLVARCAAGQNGRLQDAWRRCYTIKSARAPELCRRFSAAIQEMFRFNCAYCDVHTNHQPWRNTDYDARVPGAGKFTSVYFDYGELLSEQRRIWNGPVFSEGDCHWLYAGLNDGNYGRDDRWRFDRGENPWIVDFDLRRIHPLVVTIGVGNYWQFYPDERPKGMSLDRAMDRIFAATLAFGHSPFFFGGAQEGKGPDIELRSYFLLQPIAAYTTQSEAAEVSYLNADGLGESLERAVFTGVVNRSQIHVRYADGTEVVVNGSRHEDLVWKRPGGKRIVLPPDGFWARSGDGCVRVWSGRMADGHRAEFAVLPDAVFLNGRGRMTDFGALGKSDRPIVMRKPGCKIGKEGT